MLENDINKIIIEPRDDGNDLNVNPTAIPINMNENNPNSIPISNSSGIPMDSTNNTNANDVVSLNDDKVNENDLGTIDTQTQNQTQTQTQEIALHVETDDRNKNSRNKIINRHRSMLFSDEVVSEAVNVLLDVTNYVSI